MTSGTRRGLGVSVTPRPFFTPGERPCTHCPWWWLGPRAGLDRCGKSRPPPRFDPPTVQPVASRYTPGERPCTHCPGWWLGPRAGLDRCGKSRPPPRFDPPTVQPVASRKKRHVQKSAQGTNAQSDDAKTPTSFSSSGKGVGKVGDWCLPYKPVGVPH